MDATRSVYLIDTENQHDWWVGNIKSNTANDKVVLFYSVNSPPVHYELIEKLLMTFSVRQLEFVETYPGKNSQDFFIMNRLGQMIAKAPKSKYIVISEDKGYDPLLWSLTQKGYKAYRRCYKANDANRVKAPNENEYNTILLNIPKGCNAKQKSNTNTQLSQKEIDVIVTDFCIRHDIPESKIQAIVDVSRHHKKPFDRTMAQEMVLVASRIKEGKWQGAEKQKLIKKFSDEATSTLLSSLNAG